MSEPSNPEGFDYVALGEGIGRDTATDFTAMLAEFVEARVVPFAEMMRDQYGQNPRKVFAGFAILLRSAADGLDAPEPPAPDPA